MRALMVGLGTIMIIITTFFSMATLQVNASIRAEVSTALNEAIYQSEVALYEQEGDIDSNDDLLEVFNSCLKKMIADGRQVSVSVYGVDYEKGLLDIGVTATYQNMWGKPANITERRTIIIDQIMN